MTKEADKQAGTCSRNTAVSRETGAEDMLHLKTEDDDDNIINKPHLLSPANTGDGCVNMIHCIARYRGC